MSVKLDSLIPEVSDTVPPAAINSDNELYAAGTRFEQVADNAGGQTIAGGVLSVTLIE